MILFQIQEYIAKSDAAEERSNGLELENALLKRQLIEKTKEIPESNTQDLLGKERSDSDVDSLVQVGFHICNCSLLVSLILNYFEHLISAVDLCRSKNSLRPLCAEIRLRLR